MTDPLIGESSAQLECPSADTPVLVNRKLNPAAGATTLTVFADDRWNLTPGLFESHVPTTRLNFTAVPERFRDAVKHYCWQLINHDAPRKLRQTKVSRLALRTIAISQPRFVTFVLWLDSHDVGRFADVTREHLDQFLNDVLASDVSNGMKAASLTEVLRFWSYRSRLPESMRLPVPPPWDGEEPYDILGVVVKSGVNRTPRIHTDTIDMLLMWSLRFVDTFADDIINAFAEYVTLWRYSASVRDSGIRGQDRRRTVDHSEVRDYLEHLRTVGGSLPGRRRDDGTIEVHWAHLVRVLRTGDKAFTRDHIQLRRLIEESGLPISDQISLATPITATIDGQPWLATPIRYDDARLMAERLRTACFVVIAYLSGMRTNSPQPRTRLRRTRSRNGTLDDHRTQVQGGTRQ